MRDQALKDITRQRITLVRATSATKTWSGIHDVCTSWRRFGRFVRKGLMNYEVGIETLLSTNSERSVRISGKIHFIINLQVAIITPAVRVSCCLDSFAVTANRCSITDVPPH
jgi:hypothetical protein